jgi:hypothetical protein
MKRLKKKSLSVVLICAFAGVVVSLHAGSVRDFTTSTARITMGANLYPDLTNLTLSVWIKTSTAPANYAAIAGRGYLGVYTGFGLNFKSPDLLAFQTRVKNNSVQADISYPFDGNWHHVAGVRDGDVTRLYLDGELKDEASGALETLFASNFVFALGMRNDGGTGWGYPYKGLMAEVRLWNYARSTQEIRGDMFRRLTGDGSL